MKKLLSIVLSLCMLLSITAGLNHTAYADIIGDFEYEIIDDDTIEITGYNGSATDLTIPSTLGGYYVTSIGDEAFEDCDSLTSITIPNSVTNIGEAAFSYCNNLKSVKIGSGIKKVRDSTFFKCTNLETVIFSDNTNITYIGYATFSNCEKLKNIKIPYGVKTFGAYAFYNCKSLEKIELPDSVTELNNASVFKDSGLKEIKMSKNIIGIGYGFIENTPLYNDKSNWDNGVLYLDNYLIEAEENLENGECIIREDTEVIACSAFGGSNIKDIIIPKSVINIGTYAFSDCKELNSITIMNPGCIIYEQSYGSSSVITAKVIIGYTGSTAEDYATKKNIPFKSIGVHNHKFESYFVNPTCVTSGYNCYTCTDCGYSYKDYVDEIGSHQLGNEKVVAPTCTEKGYTETKCIICNEIFRSNYLPAIGHSSISANNAVKATCEKDGKNADTKCSNCGVILTIGDTITATGHTVVTDKAIKATYAKAGKTEGKHCSTCGEVIVAQKTVAKLTVPKITLSTVKSKKSKQITVSWKKNTKVTGYEIQCATNSKFTKNKKTVKISKNGTKSKTISKLKGKTKYYVRIRAYKLENGKKYYSSWSSTKTVTTKK